MKYQVGDLFCAVWSEKSLFIITEIPEKDFHIVVCMKTLNFFGYTKENISSDFRKVN